MTTPRVTEIPLRLVAVERDSFADAPIAPRNSLERQANRVREVMRARTERGAARSSRATPSQLGPDARVAAAR